MENKEPLGFSIDEAVKATGIGRTKIFEAIREQRLRAKKCGRRTVILAEDLQAFLKSLPDREAA